MKSQLLLLIVAFLSASYQEASAQISVEEAMTKKHPDCRDVFLNAQEVLPELYKQKSFDSLKKAIDIWQINCGYEPEIRYTEILLSIERSSFSITQNDSDLIDLLVAYSVALKNYDKHYYYKPYEQYYKFSSMWAKFLLQRNNLSSTEKFICNVFAGNIKEPAKEIKQNKEEYADLYDMLNKALAEQKKGGSTEFTIISGVWVPTGNISLLGVHPSIGLQFGGRYDKHQIDITIQMRFVNSIDSYTVKRNDNLYALDHYFGYYLGLDYNYYFVNKTKYDVGTVAGIGFDGFDIAVSGDNHENDYLKPFSISSLNLNAGLRFNYIFNPHFYLGLQGRYNFINYGTHGGSNLNGDAFSIDVIFGFTSRPNNVYRHYY
jgi:hypothetical protein